MSNPGLFEVELRGVLSKRQYMDLYSYLTDHSNSYLNDDKISHFFIIKDRILKVVKNNNNTAYRVLKIGDETKNILEELEISIPTENVEDMVKLFVNLGYDKVNRVEQLRTNFFYKGAIVSLKYTNDRGFHFELEMSANNKKEAIAKKEILIGICNDLKLKSMTPEEIQNKIRRINKIHGFI